MVNSIGYNPYSFQSRYLIPFQGADSASVQNYNAVEYTAPSNIQTPVNTSIPNDIVEISAGNKINETSNQEKKKKGVSTLAKVGIAIGGTALAGILAHKFIPPMRVQSRVQRIFLEDFSKEEAKAIQKKYQDILKISDKDEFLDKLFTELKKDYKLDAINIKLDKTGKVGEKYGEIAAKASWDAGTNIVRVDKNCSNKDLLESITHELRHAKQNLYAYKTSINDKEYYDMYVERYKSAKRKILKEKGKTEEEINKVLSSIKLKEQDMTTRNDKFSIINYSSMGVERINESDRKYAWGKKMLNSLKILANENHEVYYRAPDEIDASIAGHTMSRMVNNELGIIQKFGDWIRKTSEIKV